MMMVLSLRVSEAVASEEATHLVFAFRVLIGLVEQLEHARHLGRDLNLGWTARQR
jgi:hypothetical protein